MDKKDIKVTYNFQKFNFNSITKPSVFLIIGKRDVGKTTLVKDLLCSNNNKKYIFTSAYGDSEDYERTFPSDSVFNDHTVDIFTELKNIVDIQCKERTNPITIVFDSCLTDSNDWKNDILKYLFFNGRCDKINLIITSQCPLGIPPAIRANIDYIFMFKESMVNNKKKLYEYYGGMLPSFDIFCKVMSYCTENFESLVIHNTSSSNKLSDQIFWYNANLDNIKIQNKNSKSNSQNDSKDSNNIELLIKSTQELIEVVKDLKSRVIKLENNYCKNSLEDTVFVVNKKD